MRPEIGKRYKHYKGNIYEVIAVGYNSESLEEVVVYKGEYIDPQFGKDPIWVRPLSMFIEQIEYGGKTIDRFSPL